jgi:hypothetical protein
MIGLGRSRRALQLGERFYPLQADANGSLDMSKLKGMFGDPIATDELVRRWLPALKGHLHTSLHRRLQATALRLCPVPSRALAESRLPNLQSDRVLPQGATLEQGLR